MVPSVRSSLLAAAVVALVTVAALVALGGTPPADAASRIKVTTKAFEVQLSGRHEVAWAYYSRRDRPTCGAWSFGGGGLVVDYETKKKARYELQRITRKGRADELRWGAAKYRLPQFEILQHGQWHHNDPMRAECTPCGPQSEFGPCTPDPPKPPAPKCPKRKAIGVLDLSYYPEGSELPKVEDLSAHFPTPALLAEVRYQDDLKAAANCYPQERGQTLPLPQPAALLLDADRLTTMGRGETRTFSTKREEYFRPGDVSDDCGSLVDNVGMSACGSTKIKLVVQRVR